MNGPRNEAKERDEKFMRLAIEEARIGDLTPGAGEVGCVIVKGDVVVASGHNEAKLRHDPTAHAEIVTLRKLGSATETIDFSGCTLYVTLQPCSMCAVACVWARISRIVYGATRCDVNSMYFDAKHVNAADLIRDAFQENIQISGGVLANECSRFYYRPEDNPPPGKRTH
jgi:tRNA(adenine34) deaminase